MTIIYVMMTVFINSLSVLMFKYSKFFNSSIHFCSYTDCLNPLWALVLHFNFSVGIIRAAICRKLPDSNQILRKCRYLSTKLTFWNSLEIKRSIFSQLKRKFLVSITKWVESLKKSMNLTSLYCRRALLHDILFFNGLNYYTKLHIHLDR